MRERSSANSSGSGRHHPEWTKRRHTFTGDAVASEFSWAAASAFQTVTQLETLQEDGGDMKPDSKYETPLAITIPDDPTWPLVVNPLQLHENVLMKTTQPKVENNRVRSVHLNGPAQRGALGHPVDAIASVSGVNKRQPFGRSYISAFVPPNHLKRPPEVTNEYYCNNSLTQSKASLPSTPHQGRDALKNGGVTETSRLIQNTEGCENKEFVPRPTIRKKGVVVKRRHTVNIAPTPAETTTPLRESFRSDEIKQKSENQPPSRTRRFSIGHSYPAAEEHLLNGRDVPNATEQVSDPNSHTFPGYTMDTCSGHAQSNGFLNDVSTAGISARRTGYSSRSKESSRQVGYSPNQKTTQAASNGFSTPNVIKPDSVTEISFDAMLGIIKHVSSSTASNQRVDNVLRINEDAPGSHFPVRLGPDGQETAQFGKVHAKPFPGGKMPFSSRYRQVQGPCSPMQFGIPQMPTINEDPLINETVTNSRAKRNSTSSKNAMVNQSIAVQNIISDATSHFRNSAPSQIQSKHGITDDLLRSKPTNHTPYRARELPSLESMLGVPSTSGTSKFQRETLSVPKQWLRSSPVKSPELTFDESIHSRTREWMNKKMRASSYHGERNNMFQPLNLVPHSRVPAEPDSVSNPSTPSETQSNVELFVEENRNRSQWLHNGRLPQYSNFNTRTVNSKSMVKASSCSDLETKTPQQPKRHIASFTLSGLTPACIYITLPQVRKNFLQLQAILLRAPGPKYLTLMLVEEAANHSLAC